jgi:hypothetical protein
MMGGPQAGNLKMERGEGFRRGLTTISPAVPWPGEILSAAG